MTVSHHAPARLSTYLRVHTTRLGQLRNTGFMGDDTLEVLFEDGHLYIEGEIACRGGIVVRVWKVLRVIGPDGDPLVQTTRYAYNASIRGHCSFLRFDNSHPYPGYPDNHHRHDLD